MRRSGAGPLSGRPDVKALRGLQSSDALIAALDGLDPAALSLLDAVKVNAILSDRVAADRRAGVAVPDAATALLARLLCDHPLDLPPRASGAPVRHLTLLCPYFAPGSHLSAIGTFAGFLLANPRFERLSLVFTAEAHPKIWVPATRADSLAQVTADLDRTVAAFYGGQVPDPDPRSRLRIVLAPDEAGLAAGIGDAVIRYEGAVARNQVRLCLHAIHARRPVLGTVGTGVLRDLPAVDLLMTPAHRALDPDEAHFLRPLPRFPDDPARLSFAPPPDGARTLLTGYTKDKLARGLAQLTDTDWAALESVFRQDPRMRWHLFGADDPEAVLAAVPPRIRAALPGRIAADRRIDLGTAFRHGFAFLALPGVGGSGTTAKLALREAVPVLVCRDSRRDISNMFPDPPAERDFPALMRVLAGWTDRPEARARFLSGQLANINARADLPAKTAEFDAILDRAVAAWRARAASK